MKAATNANDSANAYIGLVNYYYSKGFSFDSTKARLNLDLDINTLKNLDKEPASYYVAIDYSLAASFEADINLQLTRKYMDSSIVYYNNMHQPYLREALKDNLNNQIDALNKYYNLDYVRLQ